MAFNPRNFLGWLWSLTHRFDPKAYKCLGCNTVMYRLDEFLRHPCRYRDEYINGPRFADDPTKEQAA